MRVAIIDDHEIVREGVRHLCEKEPDIEFAWGAADYAEGVSLIERQAPQVLLLDLMLGDGRCWAALADIEQRFSPVRVAIYSAIGNAQLVAQALATGAAGYILKKSHTKELPDLLRAIQLGEQVIDAELSKDYRPHPSRGEIILKPIEQEILQLISGGLDNHQIAERVQLSYHTVKYHIASMLRRFGAKNRAELVRIGRDLHLLPVTTLN